MVSNDLGTQAPAIMVEVKEPTYQEMIEVIAKKNNVNPELAVAISRCESELRQFNKDGSLLRGRQNPDDVGLFQINEYYHLSDSKKLGFDVHTPKGNIDYAMYIIKRDGIRHWTYSKPCWGHKVTSHQVALAH